MTEVVRKGIQEAQLQLQKANEERLLEEVRPQASALWYLEVTCPPGGLFSPASVGLCLAGAAATDPCGGLCAELVFSFPSLAQGKDI